MKRFLTNIARLVFGKRNSGSLSRVYVLAFDIFLVICALIIIPILRYYPDLSNLTLIDFLQKSISILLVFIIGFLITGSYKGLVRYTGFKDIEQITRTTGWVFVTIVICKILINNTESLQFLRPYFPAYLTVILICIVALVFMIVARLIIRRIYNEYLRPQPIKKNVVIYGAGDAGPITQNALYQDTSTQYNIVSFVDDSKDKIGKSVNGVADAMPKIWVEPGDVICDLQPDAKMY